ncbi:MAG: hypothetical protein ACI395_03630 [Candidatus Cryptobacteroides sp.]
MSSSIVIPELNYLLQLVERQYGRKLSSTTDFESLSVIIEKETGELLSSSTLKRLYGYVTLKPVPRKATLDILSKFVGKHNYEDFCTDLKENPVFNSTFFSSKIVYSSELEVSQHLRIGWMPDRVILLKYLGDMLYEVIESYNSKLLRGDRFEQVSFMMGYPLYISRILRDGEYTPAYLAGMNGGLNLLEIE